MYLRLAAIAFFCTHATLFAQPASDDSPRRVHSLRENSHGIGPRIRLEITRSTRLPLNKRYEQLNAEERQAILETYENLPAGDEPPFPAEGLLPITKALIRIQEVYPVAGEILFIVDVDEIGAGLNVSAHSKIDPAFLRVAAQVLLLTKYKPAKCSGLPCKMQYAYRVAFTLR